MTDTKMTNDEMAAGTDDVVDATNEPVEPAQDAQEPADEAEDTQGEEEPEDDTKGGREAAKYRRRLRDTEAERDALTERVEALQRSVVDSIVTESGKGGRMHSAEPFWAAGTELADMLDEDGNVDRDKVLAACDDVCSRFGITRRPGPGYVPGEGSIPRVEPRDSMANVIMGKRN